MSKDPDFMFHISGIIGDSHRLVGGIEAFLQAGIVGGDAGRTGITITLQGLDAAE